MITQAKEEKDSIGGVLTCVCRNVPVGLGEPSFDKLEAMLAHAMLSIPATKGKKTNISKNLIITRIRNWLWIRWY